MQPGLPHEDLHGADEISSLMHGKAFKQEVSLYEGMQGALLAQALMLRDPMGSAVLTQHALPKTMGKDFRPVRKAQ